MRAENPEAGTQVTIRSWPKWVPDRSSTDDCRKWVKVEPRVPAMHHHGPMGAFTDEG